MTEDEVVGWHHRLNGHESEQALGDGEGQGSLACCSPWGHEESGNKCISPFAGRDPLQRDSPPGSLTPASCLSRTVLS